MEFGHYSNEAAQLAADVVNTLGSITGTEYLPDTATLRKFMTSHGITPPRSMTQGQLEEVWEVRDRLRRVFETPDADSMSVLLNRMLTEVGARPQLTDHDGEPLHLHFVSADASPADRIQAAAAMGLALVLCDFGRERMGLCEASPCRDAFVDMSKNRSRRYCSDTCSSRMNVAAYRARARSGPPA